MSKNDKEEIKQALSDLPEPSFNNTDTVSPAVTPIVVAPASIPHREASAVEDQLLKPVDKKIFFSEKAPRIEKLARVPKPNVIKRFFAIAKPQIAYLIFAILFAFINSIFEIFIPLLIGQGIDCIAGAGMVDFGALPHIIYLLIACIFGFAIFRWLTNKMANTLAYKIEERLHVDIFKKFNKVAIKTIDSASHGDLQSRMINDVDDITTGFVMGLTSFFDCLATIVLTLIFMFRTNIPITIVIVCITPLSIVFSALIAKRTNKLFKKQAKAVGDLSGHLAEMVGNQKIVKAFMYEDRSIDRFNQIDENLRAYNEKALYYSTVINPATRFINSILYAIVAIMGTISAVGGVMTIGAISVMLSYANKYTKPFNEITDVFSDIQTAYAASLRVFNVLDIPNEVSDEGKPALQNCDGTVTFDHVYFSYTSDHKLIEDLNLHVKSGQKIAIVGPTGCGKSTMINLLMRFYDVDKGAIRISGTDVRDITRNSLRSEFGMVLQETWLFSGTVKDNIAFGKINATMAEIIEVSKRVGAHNFIQNMPDGYNTRITEGGDNLSAGQRQLICIARLMLIKPSMLILDEATSNIDTRTELQIQKAFNELMDGKTSFVVAHRLSTIVSSDLILVMNKGKVIEMGTHKQLLDNHGFYYNLYNSQFSNT